VCVGRTQHSRTTRVGCSRHDRPSTGVSTETVTKTGELTTSCIADTATTTHEREISPLWSYIRRCPRIPQQRERSWSQGERRNLGWGPRGSILNRHPWLPLKTALLTLTHSLADTAICRLEPPPGDFSEVSLHRARGAAGDQGAGLDGRAHAARVQAVHVLRPPRAERVQALPALPGRPHAPALPGALRCFETPFSRTDETTWEEHQYTLHPVGAFRRSGVRGLLWQTLCTRVGQSRSRSDVMIFAHQRTVLVRSAFRRSLRPNATHDCTLATARRACRPHVVSGRSALCNAAALALALPWRGICPHPAVSTASTLLICITEMGCVLLRCEHNSGSNHATLRRATSNTFHRVESTQSRRLCGSQSIRYS